VKRQHCNDIAGLHGDIRPIIHGSGGGTGEWVVTSSHASIDTTAILVTFLTVNNLVILVVKVKVKVTAGKIYLPKEVRERGFEEGSEYEAVVVGDELRLRPPQPESLSTLKALKKTKPEASVEEMAKVEVVEDA